MSPRRAVVTGAFSYIGAAVARELLARGWAVHTLTNRARPPGAEAVTAAPFAFDPEHLARELSGADLFVNTYWVRLDRQGGFAAAIANHRALVEAAARARVRRLVHVSVTNASPASPLGYYRGKAEVDALVKASGLSHAIVRPTLVVGPNDVLTSNICWLLRRFPVFPVPGGGACRLQPVTLADVGRIAADAATSADPAADLDAAGPEILTFRDYVALLARACGLRRWIVPAPDALALAALRLLGLVLGDVVLGREELGGLRQELLVSRAPPLGRERVSDWLFAAGGDLGRAYVNDMRRHCGADARVPLPWPR